MCSRVKRPSNGQHMNRRSTWLASSAMVLSFVTRDVKDALAAELAPLGNASWIERLEPPGGNVLFVTPPVGAREPRPVVVAVHGAGDRAEWACGGWRLAVRSY